MPFQRPSILIYKKFLITLFNFKSVKINHICKSQNIYLFLFYFFRRTSRHVIGRRNVNYGDSPATENNVDLHNKEFCVDVSVYQPVVWQEVIFFPLIGHMTPILFFNYVLGVKNTFLE